MKLVLLDRDGVINADSDDFIKSVDELQILPGSLAAITALTLAGYRVVIVSNQSGLARGLLDADDLSDIHARLAREVIEHGGHIDAFFFCPHGPEEGCKCRKPGTGLLRDVAKRLNVSLESAVFVGDSQRDLEAARTAGAIPILVRTGNGQETEARLDDNEDVAIYDDLASFVAEFLSTRATQTA